MWRKKGDIRLTDLPRHLQSDFTAKLTPRLYEFLGTLSAWEQPTEDDIKGLWKSVFPQEQCLDFGTKDSKIVIKLVMCSVMTSDVLCIDSLKQIEDRVSQWRKKFGEHGLEALEEVTFNDLPTNDTESRSLWCEWALCTGDDSCRPFYYATYNEPEDEESQLKAKVLFALHLPTLPCHSLFKLFLLGYFSVPTHCCYICDTRRLVSPH